MPSASVITIKVSTLWRLMYCNVISQCHMSKQNGCTLCILYCATPKPNIYRCINFEFSSAITELTPVHLADSWLVLESVVVQWHK